LRAARPGASGTIRSWSSGESAGTRPALRVRDLARMALPADEVPLHRRLQVDRGLAEDQAPAGLARHPSWVTLAAGRKGPWVAVVCSAGPSIPASPVRVVTERDERKATPAACVHSEHRCQVPVPGRHLSSGTRAT